MCSEKISYFGGGRGNDGSDCRLSCSDRCGVGGRRWRLYNTGPGAFDYGDFGGYWLHRLFHAVPLLWRLHSVHHADSDLDVSTSFRHHPVEFVVGSGAFWLAFVMTGFPPDIAAAYLVSASILSCLQHANIS